ncbi:hypothetical protein HU161_01450 [Metamycoplasma hominis]|nr:hypothetical protein HU161_01450 [Metamycoplasma hominis]
MFSYTKIKEIIASKIKNIAIVDKKEKDDNGKHFIWFDSLTFIENITFDNVINS